MEIRKRYKLIKVFNEIGEIKMVYDREKYTQLHIPYEVKKQLLILKAEGDYRTLGDLVQDLIIRYREKNKNNK